MQLSQVKIRHFRSLYEVALPLKPLTIVIGPNASGKSNLFKALRFLFSAVAGDRLEWQAYDAQIDELLWYGYGESGVRPEEIFFALHYGNAENQPQALYQAVVQAQDYLQIAREELHLASADRDDELFPYYERQGETVYQKTGHRGSPLTSPYRSQARSARTLTLRDEGPNLRLEGARQIYRQIQGWRFIDVDLGRARQPAFVPAVPDEVPPLAGDGSNLSAFLWALSWLQTEDFEAISNALGDFIDLPQQMRVEHDAERGGQNARYGFIETPFGENRLVPPFSISDGTIRLLTQLALLLGDRSVSLACLEEPDHGLHPRLMRYLADVLRQTVTPIEEEKGASLSPPQVIVTTHSPEFLDCFDLEAEADDLQVYIAERDEEGKTHFIPASAPEFAPWLEKYQLGEAVRRRFV